MKLAVVDMGKGKRVRAARKAQEQKSSIWDKVRPGEYVMSSKAKGQETRWSGPYLKKDAFKNKYRNGSE